MKNSSTPLRAGLIGHPVAQSKSPIIQNYWLTQQGVTGSYEAVDVTPPELADFVERFLRTGFWRGANVTIPHKQSIIPLLDRLTPVAQAIGAVNTLWKENGELVGDNTDAQGFLAQLDDSLGASTEYKIKSATLLGAGGAARALVYALLDRGVEHVLICNRNQDRAERLAGHFGKALVVKPWSQRSALLADQDLLVNATSLGMINQAALEIDLTALPAHARVYDLVYNPLETALLRAAKNRGLVPIDGLGMLLHQAAPGFTRWFGSKPAIDNELRRTVIKESRAT